MPNAELRVVGTLGLRVETDDPSVKIMGLVDDLDAAYAGARVVINPAVAGTGLKIKTVEALCHHCPLVTWPSGVEGITPDLRALCYVATDWYMFPGMSFIFASPRTPAWRWLADVMRFSRDFQPTQPTPSSKQR